MILFSPLSPEWHTHLSLSNTTIIHTDSLSPTNVMDALSTIITSSSSSTYNNNNEE